MLFLLLFRAYLLLPSSFSGSFVLDLIQGYVLEEWVNLSLEVQLLNPVYPSLFWQNSSAASRTSSVCASTLLYRFVEEQTGRIFLPSSSS